jgi:TPR repeat protein
MKATRFLLAIFVLAAMSVVIPSYAATKNTKDKDKDSIAKDAPTGPARRAFIVGIERYSDGDVQSLARANTDAKDLGHDLEQVGFDPKNITVATDIANKADFNKKFDAFLKTVKEGDFVFFFFSGHGLGVETSDTNYLLFGDLKSQMSYTRAQLQPSERKDSSVVMAKMATFVDGYTNEEIPRSGISVKEIEQRIGDHKPATALVVLDACRAILRSDATEARKVKRTNDSGSRLLPEKEPPEGFLVLYSASFGEQAVESFDAIDVRRNSLFVEVFRDELMRPGQSLIDLAARTRLVTRSLASNRGFQQEPEYHFHGDSGPDDVYLVDTIGERRFQISIEKCAGSKEEWDRISVQRRIDDLDRHIRRFGDCPTADEARRAKIGLADSVTEPATQPVAAVRRQIDPCDQLAASDTDRARPPEVPGVAFAAVDPEAAIAACNASIASNPLVVRYLFNLGRAQMAQANKFNIVTQKNERTEAFRRARLALEDAQQRGYVAAIYNLAVIYDQGLGVDQDVERANDLFKRAANQGFPLAMYTLAQRYSEGDKGSIIRDEGQAYEWFAKGSDSGLIDATVKVGDYLWRGIGVPSGANPRRAVEALQRAAEAGSNQAKILLGNYYAQGKVTYSGNAEDSKSIRPDPALALLWMGRAAESNDPSSQTRLAGLLERGDGLPSAQPEIAERYWRFAAYGGDVEAEVELAKRLRLGKVLVKPENGDSEAVRLLNRAFAYGQGSARAALELARIYRAGTPDTPKDPIMAMKYAYRAIKLRTLADPLENDGSFYNEIAPAHLLAEMAKSGEAVSPDGRPLLSKDEVDRLEKFYGKVDPATNEVKVRRIAAPLVCYVYKDRGREQQLLAPGGRYFVWVWDWGRDESPTETQLRRLEHITGCGFNQDLRGTLSASFRQAQKNNVAFADLIDEQIKAASNQTDRSNRQR